MPTSPILAACGWRTSPTRRLHRRSALTPDKLRLCDITTGEELVTLKWHTDWVTPVALAPEGKTLASTAADGVLKLWDVVECKEVASIEVQENFFKEYPRINSVVFSPDLIGQHPCPM